VGGPERLEGRDGQVWAAYVGGATQEAIARQHGVTQQRVSQILSEIRATIGDSARLDAALLAQERTDALLAAVWPAAMGGDPKAVGAALRVLERQAKALGTDAVEPLRVSLERRTDVEGDMVAAAVTAVVDVLSLDEERRQLAVSAARAALLGEELPGPVVPPAAPVEGPEAEPDLMDTYREWCAREGVDPDEDGLDGEEGDGGVGER
jgi:hypothetical protein